MPDLTPKELEKNKKLRAEVKEKIRMEIFFGQRIAQSFADNP